METSITKEELADLPVEEFEGRIIVIQDDKEAKKATDYLSTQTLLGFDSETRPNFKKGSSNKIALIQISTQDTCFLFRLNHIGIPEGLTRILTSPDIKKIGLSLKDDFAAIRKRKSIEPANFVDLQTMVKKYGITDIGLQRIYGILFGKRITKGQRLTNWEAEILSDAQKKYAALDAWSCLQIYNQLLSINPNPAL